MPDTNHPLKVFLCHAHSDQDAVRALYFRLQQDGVDPWFDKESLLPGQDWKLEIRKAVRDADVVIVCLSKQFNQAGFRQREVRLALEEAKEKPEGDIFIIPVRLEECEILESLKQWQWVDLFEESGYRKLMLAFHEKAKRVGANFELQKQHFVSTTSDKSFLNKVVEELKTQEKEEPSTRISAVQKFPAPGTRAEGLAWDGSNLWLTDNSGEIFKISPTGKILDSVRSPDVTPQGIAWDGASFWLYTTNRSFIYQFQIVDGNVRTGSSFRSPAEVVGGGISQDLTWDGEHLWYANQFKVYKLDKSGKVLSSFTSPKNVAGLDWDGSHLWVAHNNFPENAGLSMVSPDGDVLKTSVASVLEINTMTWADGYLWTLGQDTVGGKPMIYKLSIPAK